MKQKIVFFGSSKYTLPILEVLQKNFDLKLVLTTENPKDDLASQGETLRSCPVIKYCVENKIPYLSVSNLSDPSLISHLSILNSIVAVLADFGLIIPKDILNTFYMGIINVHPSLLPKYRGPTPVQTAIVNGEKTTGVSIMKLDEQIDHGPILGQEKEKILDTDTAESLYKRLFEKGANLLFKVLFEYLNGRIKPTPQNHKEATFTNHLTRQDGYLDISNTTTAVTKIDRMIRAYYPGPGVWTRLRQGFGGQAKLKIIKFLPDKKIQVSGKKPISYKDFLNGYPEAKNILPILQK